MLDMDSNAASSCNENDSFCEAKPYICRTHSSTTYQPGTDVMILKIFSPKNSAKKLAFWTQLCKILIITLVFEKNAIFFAKSCRKSQKIVIITSTPGVLAVLADLLEKHDATDLV
jgi:hypothetical protein